MQTKAQDYLSVKPFSLLPVFCTASLLTRASVWRKHAALNKLNFFIDLLHSFAAEFKFRAKSALS